MIDQEERTIKDMSGNDVTFIISKVPAVAAREIFTQYIPTAMPKVGNYEENQKLMLKLMSFVAVPQESGPLNLTSQALIDNHVDGFETLMKLEKEMIEYNTSFFVPGKISSSLEPLIAKALQSTIKTLTGSLQASLQAAKQASESSNES